MSHLSRDRRYDCDSYPVPQMRMADDLGGFPTPSLPFAPSDVRNEVSSEAEFDAAIDNLVAAKREDAEASLRIAHDFNEFAPQDDGVRVGPTAEDIANPPRGDAINGLANAIWMLALVAIPVVAWLIG